MTPALLISALAESLEPAVAAMGGRLSVCETPEDTLGLLAVSPERWRCVVQWGGEDGDDATLGTSSEARVVVIVQTPRGKRADRGADAWREAPGRNARPILELVDFAKRHLFSLAFTDDEQPGELRADVHHSRSNGRAQCFRFVGGDWLEIEGVEIRQYEMTFAIRYASEPPGE